MGQLGRAGQMSDRKRLPNRRAHELLDFEHNGETLPRVLRECPGFQRYAEYLVRFADVAASERTNAGEQPST